MAILLVQIPVGAVSIDETRLPDRDESQILEHLVHYCGKFDPLPAITVVIEGTTATVVRGHKYLLAARALGRPSVRAVVASPPSSAEVKPFLSGSGVMVLDWEAIKAKEEQDLTPMGWHVFFFGRSLSNEEKRAFDEGVGALFSDRNSIHVLHDDSGPLAEFEAPTPVTDPEWMAKHLAVFTRFARQHAPIVSYQGRRFPGSELIAAR